MMTYDLRKKLRSGSGMSRLILVLLVLVIILSITSLIPTYMKYRREAKALACATALDSARRQLATDFMFDGFENGTAEDAKDVVAYAMNGWDDLCPDNGSVYIVPHGDSPLAWDVVCGLHGSDSKQRTRLNSGNVLDQLREALNREQKAGNLYPETLTYTLHGRERTAYLVDEATGLKRGTRLTEGYDGIVAFYSLVGHSDFGADAGMDDGALWYFSFADEDHCAAWSYRDSWTGDSYR